MFHPYRKDSSYLRAAMLASYKGKCTYCGSVIQQRNMHVDHVIPSHMREIHDIEVQQYLSELDQSGFIIDSIVNYVPTCPACNIAKNNRIFAASNLRYYHEMERNHIDEILQIISKL